MEIRRYKLILVATGAIAIALVIFAGNCVRILCFNDGLAWWTAEPAKHVVFNVAPLVLGVGCWLLASSTRHI
jgi:hypothetical protein